MNASIKTPETTEIIADAEKAEGTLYGFISLFSLLWTIACAAREDGADTCRVTGEFRAS